MDVWRELDVTLEALRSASRNRTLTTARGLIAARAVDGHIATLSEVARFLHRSVAACLEAPTATDHVNETYGNPVPQPRP